MLSDWYNDFAVYLLRTFLFISVLRAVQKFYARILHTKRCIYIKMLCDIANVSYSLAATCREVLFLIKGWTIRPRMPIFAIITICHFGFVFRDSQTPGVKIKRKSTLFFFSILGQKLELLSWQYLIVHWSSQNITYNNKKKPTMGHGWVKLEKIEADCIRVILKNVSPYQTLPIVMVTIF